MTPKSGNSSGKESLKEVASSAVSERRVDLGNNLTPNRQSVRDSIRLMHAHSRRDLPEDCFLTAKTTMKGKEHVLTIDRDLIEWTRHGKTKGFIDTDDLIGAETIGHFGVLKIHVYQKGKGKGKKALMRKHVIHEFHFTSHNIAQAWVNAIKELVRWHARIPGDPLVKRKIKVIVNPHSGKKEALNIWNKQVKPIFDLVDIEGVMEETTYSGHATDMGENYSPSCGFEALVFISGDGTINEYMYGLLARPEEEWRAVIQSTPLSLISAGTQNAFGQGLGLPTPTAALYSIIKRKMRPMDVITATAAGDTSVHYSSCGLGWGTPGDISKDSEKYRWLGTKRYGFLKLKYGLMPLKHTAKIKYIITDPQPELKVYDDIRNDGADDQHSTEQGSIYEVIPTPQSARDRKWDSVVQAVRDPAADIRYPDELWIKEEGPYIAVGVLNTVPDGIYTHPSDGNMDLILARKGNIFKMIKLGVLYLFGKENKSSLISYIKVKAAVIEQGTDEEENGMNIDGEVLPGPGPWKMEIIPSLFKVLSEK